MLAALEKRLDNVTYRMGLPPAAHKAASWSATATLRQRQESNIPSFTVRLGDVVEIRESGKNNTSILGARDATAHTPSPSGWK